MKTLLIEIGCEEIPAGYIIPALTAFKNNILQALTKARIDHGEAKILGTPKRLALMVANVAPNQNSKTSTLSGPPERVGFDENKKPTIAAQKFAEKAGISVDAIVVADTGKGRYLTAVVEENCESSAVILEQMMAKQILALPFPKSMRWGSLSISFARPIISLAGLLGDQVLNFTSPHQSPHRPWRGQNSGNSQTPRPRGCQCGPQSKFQNFHPVRSSGTRGI